MKVRFCVCEPVLRTLCWALGKVKLSPTHLFALLQRSKIDLRRGEEEGREERGGEDEGEERRVEDEGAVEERRGEDEGEEMRGEDEGEKRRG